EFRDVFSNVEPAVFDVLYRDEISLFADLDFRGIVGIGSPAEYGRLVIERWLTGRHESDSEGVGAPNEYIIANMVHDDEVALCRELHLQHGLFEIFVNNEHSEDHGHHAHNADGQNGAIDAPTNRMSGHQFDWPGVSSR